jgi:polar amino acid transport system permease protein
LNNSDGRNQPEVSSVPIGEDVPLIGASSIPRHSGELALAAVAAALSVSFYALWTGNLVRAAALREGVESAWLEAAVWLVLLAALALFFPSAKSVTLWQSKNRALASNDVVVARICAAAAKDWAFIALGYAAAALLALAFVNFVFANDMAVGRTFFYLPLIAEKYHLVVYAFWNNIFIFVTAEILVLVWGLIVAIGRLLPGEAGRPIRMLAALYCDVFRGLPAVVTLYLIGFGLPLSGIVPSEIPGIGKVPLTWYAIIALTLTYGAYVAEVYRAGIDSIHWSQIAAARSLGLSYFQALRYVIVPQAVRRIMAPLLNDFIGLQKDTALVNVIGVIDGFNQSRIIASNAFNLSAVTIVAIIFVLITIPQARFVDRLLERDQRRMRAQG